MSKIDRAAEAFHEQIEDDLKRIRKIEGRAEGIEVQVIDISSDILTLNSRSRIQTVSLGALIIVMLAQSLWLIGIRSQVDAIADRLSPPVEAGPAYPEAEATPEG